jgi:4'-phosphopantetheinyl transferase
MSTIAWQTAPIELALEPGTIDVWRIPLGDVDQSLRSLLSEDEQLRADRFRYDRDRNRFIMARANMRRILGKYLNRPPASLEFTYGHHGKPNIVGLEFNISHSADLALLAVCGDRIVGIDIEHIHPMNDLEKLTERFFTAGEHQRIIQVPTDDREVNDRTIAFFRTWTCKESYLKATGEGIGKLKDLEIFLKPNQAAYFVNPQDWDVAEIVPEAGFVGAIVAPGVDWQTQFWQQ